MIQMLNTQSILLSHVLCFHMSPPSLNLAVHTDVLGPRRRTRLPAAGGTDGNRGAAKDERLGAWRGRIRGPVRVRTQRPHECWQ